LSTWESQRRVWKAFDFALEKHINQKDDNEESYFHAHCMHVADILRGFMRERDDNLLCAGYLHDTIEDTDTTYEELVTQFNKDIADLVMEVTHEGKKDNYGYYFPRLKTKRGILLKFADRMSNLSRMEAWNPSRQEQYIRRSRFWKYKAPNLIDATLNPEGIAEVITESIVNLKVDTSALPTDLRMRLKSEIVNYLYTTKHIDRYRTQAYLVKLIERLIK